MSIEYTELLDGSFQMMVSERDDVRCDLTIQEVRRLYQITKQILAKENQFDNRYVSKFDLPPKVETLNVAHALKNPEWYNWEYISEHIQLSRQDLHKLNDHMIWPIANQHQKSIFVGDVF